MFYTILVFDLSSCASLTGTSKEQERCADGFCITLNNEEITAEAGLCAVIPCSFSVPPGFRPEMMAWLKCESKQTCSDADIILHQNNNNVCFGFKGRVSLLEPDISLKNCSIIINDLTESDSGSYWFRINGVRIFGRKYSLFSLRATKPRMVIPPLRDGQQTTLTCIAPGTGKNDPHIPGPNTSFMTEKLTAVTQRHSSTLTFTAAVTQHHGSQVTCTVSFTNNVTTEETVTLKVNCEFLLSFLTKRIHDGH
uniref:Ig-like domain-containing protein n=1 Tax=Mola mola TaxID=94237 RepID=A0A3Q3WUP5_MOLML